jgi:hypothetical protein
MEKKNFLRKATQRGLGKGIYILGRNTEMNDDLGKSISDFIERNANRKEFDFNDAWQSEDKIKAINESDAEKVKEEQLIGIIEKDTDPAVRMTALKKLSDVGGIPQDWIKIAANDSDLKIREYALSEGLSKNEAVKENLFALSVSFGMSASSAQKKVDSDMGKLDKEIAKLVQKSPYQDVRDAYREYNSNSSKTNSSEKTKGGCYIATAVYGSYNATEVLILRRFRDNTLAKSSAGRLFIRAYYFLSPPLARRLKTTRHINNTVRRILDRIVVRLARKYKH